MQPRHEPEYDAVKVPRHSSGPTNMPVREYVSVQLPGYTQLLLNVPEGQVVAEPGSTLAGLLAPQTLPLGPNAIWAPFESTWNVEILKFTIPNAQV